MKLDLIEFKNIIDVDKDVQNQVLIWRNSDYIKKYMYTDWNTTEEEHQKWLNSLKNNSSIQVYVVYYSSEPVGIVQLCKIDSHHKTADWAFYIYPQELKIGALVEYKLISYFFEDLNFEKLNCEVIEINPSVIKLHKKFGFKEEGIKRKNIFKDNQRMDVYILGLLKEEWFESKNKILKIIERV